MIWAISNKRIRKSKGCYHSEKENIFYYSNKKVFYKEYDSGIKIAIDGFVLPRLENFDSLKHLEPADLIYKLYKKYGLDFIRHLKGVFIIILIAKGKVYLFNDRHSIKKFFIYQKENSFLISNDLDLISKNFALTFSKRNAAVFTLMEHFIDGITLFNEVRYSRPATFLSLDPELKIESYWSPVELLNLDIKDPDLTDFARQWKRIISHYIDYLKPKDITMTLTGGNDTRMVLAALLNLGLDPHTFTFGNPASNDGVIAQKIAAKINLDFNNYYVKNPTANWFGEYADTIIQSGHSLINLHRAHRLDAVEKEVTQNKDVEMIFGGFMGGDYIKGLVYDDYITARLIKLWEFDKRDKQLLIQEELGKKYLRYSESKLDELLSFLGKQMFFSASKKIERQFFYIINVIGAVHDVQDTNVFGMKIKYTVNPFMDIDFLELLFASKFSMLFKRNDSRNQFRRLMQPMFHCTVTNELCDKLSHVEYGKRSFYTPAEFLGNKLVYVIKRLYRFYKSSRFPNSFPYGEWMREYCNKQVENLDPSIEEMVQVDKLKKNLSRPSHPSHEGYWHQFTNIINLNKIVGYYKND